MRSSTHSPCHGRTAADRQVRAQASPSCSLSAVTGQPWQGGQPAQLRTLAGSTPASMLSPLSTATCCTTPAVGAPTDVSIFMALRTTSGWPGVTRMPAEHVPCHVLLLRQARLLRVDMLRRPALACHGTRVITLVRACPLQTLGCMRCCARHPTASTQQQVLHSSLLLRP